MATPARYRNLTPWAENGVLMLNTCLTVRAAQAGSHSNKGWEEFTDKVVDVVDKYGGANLGAAESTGFGRGVVFLAWGSWAAKRVAKLSKVGHSLTHPRLRGPRSPIPNLDETPYTHKRSKLIYVALGPTRSSDKLSYSIQARSVLIEAF